MKASGFVHLTAPIGPLKGRIILPGSKSMTNRALILAAQAGKPVLLDNASDAEDSQVVLQFLRQLGFAIHVQGRQIRVTPKVAATVQNEPVTVELGMAGTAMRFLTALCAFLPGSFVLQGSARLMERPLAALVDSLNAVGADVNYSGRQGFLPLRINGKPGLKPTHFTIDAGQSSQLLSALLLLAPSLPLGCTIEVMGEIATEAYITLTLAQLSEAGLTWQQTGSRFVLEQNTLRTDKLLIESDWSAAGYWLALAATQPAELELGYLSDASAQGDAAQLALFHDLGLSLTFHNHLLHVVSRGEAPRALNLKLRQMPDLAQTFAALAALYLGQSTLTGLHTLPLKETDRIAALATELTRCGRLCETSASSLTILPGTLQAPDYIRTYGDHRMAMSFAVLAQPLGSITLENPGVVAKSYPTFWQDLDKLGFTVEYLDSPITQTL